MRAAADSQEYEQAALFRDQIQALRKIREKQFVDSGKALDADVVAAVAENNAGGRICVNLAMIRGGRHLGDKSFFPQNAEGYDLPEVVEAFLAQHYLNRSVPNLIIVGEKIQRETLQALLVEQSGHKIVINANPIGDRRMWLDMAAENARLGAGTDAEPSGQPGGPAAIVATGSGYDRAGAHRVFRHQSHDGGGHHCILRSL